MQAQFNEMVVTLKKPGADILASWTPEKASASHMLVGIMDEYFEFIEAVDNYHDNCTEETADHVLEEAGDVLFYLKGMEQDLGLRELHFERAIENLDTTDLDKLILDIITSIKRHLYYNKELPGSEVADQLELLAVIVTDCAKHLLGCSLEYILEANYKKLMKGRYPNGYSDDAANKREDKEI